MAGFDKMTYKAIRICLGTLCQCKVSSAPQLYRYSSSQMIIRQNRVKMFHMTCMFLEDVFQVLGGHSRCLWKKFLMCCGQNVTNLAFSPSFQVTNFNMKGTQGQSGLTGTDGEQKEEQSTHAQTEGFFYFPTTKLYFPLLTKEKV
jgi:hypothetical protein